MMSGKRLAIKTWAAAASRQEIAVTSSASDRAISIYEIGRSREDFNMNVSISVHDP